MIGSKRNVATALLTGLVALNGCATRQAPPPAIVAAPIPPRPAPPPGVYGTLPVPLVAPDGQYMTINYGIDANAVIWHVRAALNVAALGCHGPGSEGLTPGYNAMLRQQRATFAAADAAVRARFRAQGASGWQDRHDVYQTRLYNYFAQPAGQAGFCQAAAAIIAQTAAVTPAAFGAFAASALPQLDAPFTDAYRAYTDYRRDLAAWDGRYGPNAAPEARYAVAVPVAPPAAPPIAVAAAPVPTGPKLGYAPVGPMLDWKAPTATRSAGRETRVRLADAG